MKQSINEIRSILQQTKVENEFIQSLRFDERKGVRQLLLAWDKEQQKKLQLEEQWHEMMHYENNLKNSGSKMIAGVDEVGRGPLAGPVTAAAVILPNHLYLPGLNDSKKLSLQKRENYYQLLRSQAFTGVGEASVTEIDEINIYEATKLAMERAIQALPVTPDALLIDAMKLSTDIPQTSLIKGDAKSVTIAAASVVAKVTRDRLMEKLDQVYPGYGFADNAGYGTKQHLQGMEKQGITEVHRKSFSPVRALLQ